MFKIIKKGSNNFWHIFNDGAKNVSISDFEVVLDDVLNTFVIVLRNGASIPQTTLNVLDIIVIDETSGSVEETFINVTDLRNRLVVLGYTAYLGAGNADSITGLISEGVNVTITGNGTLSEPYVISSSGGGGTTPTLQEVVEQGDEILHSSGLFKTIISKENKSVSFWRRETLVSSWYKTAEYSSESININDYLTIDSGISINYIDWVFQILPYVGLTLSNPISGYVVAIGETYVNIEDTSSNILVEMSTANGFKISNTSTGDNITITNTSATKNGVEFATLSDIITTLSGLAIDNNLDLGSFYLKATDIKINNGTKIGTLKTTNLTADRTIEFQDKNYTGVADITDINGKEDTSNKSSSYTASSTTTYANTKALVDGLATKQNALSFTPYKYLNTAQYTHTGTTAETVLSVATIPGNTFNSNDVMKLLYRCTKPSGTTGTDFMNVWINTTNSLSTATKVARLDVTPLHQYCKLNRDFLLVGGNLYSYNWNSSTNSDTISSNTAGTSTTYNTANTLYVFFTIILANTTNSVTFQLANITN